MRATILIIVSMLSQPAVAATLLLDERFPAFAGQGLAPGGGGGTLDSHDWAVAGASDGDSGFGDTRLAGDLARGRSPGGERSGGLYAFELPGGQRALGVQATSSDFTPGALTRLFVNTTGRSVGELAVDLDLWVLNDGDRSTRTSVQVAPAAGGDWLDVPWLALDTPGGRDDDGWQHRRLAAPLPVTSLAPGAGLLLRWAFDDAAGNGARDEIALAGLTLRGNEFAREAPTALDEPGTGGLLAAALMAGASRRVLLALTRGNGGATSR